MDEVAGTVYNPPFLSGLESGSSHRKAVIVSNSNPHLLIGNTANLLQDNYEKVIVS